jgi:hypothetical protein
MWPARAHQGLSHPRLALADTDVISININMTCYFDVSYGKMSPAMASPLP